VLRQPEWHPFNIPATICRGICSKEPITERVQSSQCNGREGRGKRGGEGRGGEEGEGSRTWYTGVQEIRYGECKLGLMMG